VDENGEPLVLYRGTSGETQNVSGFWLTKSKSYAEGFGEVKEYFAKVLNPMSEDEFNKTWMVDFYKYDGRLGDFHKLVVKESSQIKLADGTNTTFDPNNDDNRYKQGGRTIAQTPAPEKERIYGSDKNKPKSSKDSLSAESIKFDNKTLSSIENKVAEHNEAHPNKKVNLATAKAVVRRGMGAYSKSHRPTISGGQPNSRVAWGLARLNAFLYKVVHGVSKSGKYSQDNDLLDELGIAHKKFENGGLISFNKNKVFVDGEKIGLFEFDIKENQIEINRLYLDLENQKKGFGRKIIKQLFEYYPNIKKIILYPLPSSIPFWLRITENVTKDGYFEITRNSFDLGNKKYFFHKKGGEIDVPIAPNGKPSNLTTEQYKLVRTPEFKAWFGDWENDPANASKVVDENGEPLVVYHGTKTNRNFNVFDNTQFGNQKRSYKNGYFFTNNYEVAKSFSKRKPIVFEVFLNIRKPKKINYKGANWEGYDDNGNVKVDYDLNTLVSVWSSPFLKKDGLIAHNIYDVGDYWDGKNPIGNNYVVFKSEQIKLADGSNTTFDPNNDDIRYKKGGKISKKNRGGDCYVVAGKIALNNRLPDGDKPEFIGEPYVVHAQVTGQGAIAGLKYGHAWVEDDEYVYDYSNRRNIKIPKELYYKLGQVIIQQPIYFKYTFGETRKKMAESGHFGNWELKTESGL